MFDLVADVERYSEFVPLCQKHTIRSRKKCGDSEIMMTDMTVAYQVFRETHRSRVTLDRANGRILVESVDGPLRRLRTVWTFQSRDADSCDVGFDLSYEFASPMLALLLGGIFDAAFSRFVQAFESRADAVYGSRQRPSSQQTLKVDAHLPVRDPPNRRMPAVTLISQDTATRPSARPLSSCSAR